MHLRLLAAAVYNFVNHLVVKVYTLQFTTVAIVIYSPLIVECSETGSYLLSSYANRFASCCLNVIRLLKSF